MAELNNVFAENLAVFRKKKNMLQKDLAYELGVSISAVSNWENGANYPRLDTVYHICDVLDITIGKLLGLGECTLDCEDETLIAAYRRHPDMQKAVQKLLDI